MKRLTGSLLPLVLTALSSPSVAEATAVNLAKDVISIDGKANESSWHDAPWSALDKHILGAHPAADDFSGRYKLLWDRERLYILAEITDDVIIDSHPDPRKRYWDDDTLEVFIDADASGGEHTYSHNAFAYHIALDGNVADLGDEEVDNKQVILLNDHADSAWTRTQQPPFTMTWEVAVRIYPDTFTTAKPGEPITLKEGMTLGFMLAYCDNDGSTEREHFMGSHVIEPVDGDKNLGYIDASVFGTITLNGDKQK